MNRLHHTRPYISLLFLVLMIQLIPLFTVSQKQLIKFDHLQTDDGLSQSNVLCIFQDSRGFMWFGTEDGLNKYDGYNFTIYKNDPEKNNSLSNNFINDIAEDDNGDIWIATPEGGLDKYDRQRDHFIHFKHNDKDAGSISDNAISSLLKDSHGNIWAGTSNGVSVFDKKNNRFIKYFNNAKDNSSLIDNAITTIYEDRQHNIWIGTITGLDLFNPQKKIVYSFSP